VDGTARELPRSRKTRALLAYLAIAGRPHRRDRLCTMFWDIPDDPRGALRWSLSKLRALVDEPGRTRIHADRATVAFDTDGAAIDVLDLRRRMGAGLDSMTANQLTDAEAAFRGEFLEGLELDSCPEFQAWCMAERQELRMLRCRILKRLAALLASRPDLALPHVRTLVDLDPFDETARAMLVRVLAADGRHDEAARQHELSRRALAELGAPPPGNLSARGAICVRHDEHRLPMVAPSTLLRAKRPRRESRQGSASRSRSWSHLSAGRRPTPKATPKPRCTSSTQRSKP
jgi:DNA-binding SARP family transcriptional activator